MKIYQSTISNRSSNEEIKFNCDALSLYKLTFSLNAIGINTTMTLYDYYGSINSQIVIDKPSKIEIQFLTLLNDASLARPVSFNGTIANF